MAWLWFDPWCEEFLHVMGIAKTKQNKTKTQGIWDGNAVKLGYDDCHTTINVIKFIELKTKKKKIPRRAPWERAKYSFFPGEEPRPREAHGHIRGKWPSWIQTWTSRCP